MYEQNAEKLLLPLKNPHNMVHYDSCIKIHNTYINTNHLFYNKLVHLANKRSEITNSPFFSWENKSMVFKVNKWICFCIQNFNRNKAPQFKSQRCHDKHKRSRIKNPFQFTILSKTPTCKTAVSTSADLDIAVVEHPHLLISPSASG